MESKTSKDVCVDSTLPPTFEEACNGGSYAASGDNVHVNHSPDGKQTVAVKTCSDDGAVSEKSKLAEVPFIAPEIATMYDKDVPPPYPGDPSRQTVWSTEASKSPPGLPRLANRGKRRTDFFCWRLIAIITAIAVAYLWFQSFASIMINNHFARKLRLSYDDILRNVVLVERIFNDPAEYEGKLIYISNSIWIQKPLEYDECNISNRSVKLKRTYDRSYVYNRFGPTAEYMSRIWPQARLASSQICPRDYLDYALESSFSHLSDDEKIAPEAGIGAFKFGQRLKEKFDDYVIVADMVREVGPGQAVPVMYSAAGINAQRYSVLGQVVDGRIEPWVSIDYYDVILQREGAVSAEDIAKDRVAFRLGLLDAGNLWSYSTIALSLLIFLVVISRYQSAVSAAKNYELKQAMLSAQGP